MIFDDTEARDRTPTILWKGKYFTGLLRRCKSYNKNYPCQMKKENTSVGRRAGLGPRGTHCCEGAPQAWGGPGVNLHQ